MWGHGGLYGWGCVGGHDWEGTWRGAWLGVHVAGGDCMAGGTAGEGEWWVCEGRHGSVSLGGGAALGGPGVRTRDPPGPPPAPSHMPAPWPRAGTGLSPSASWGHTGGQPRIGKGRGPGCTPLPRARGKKPESQNTPSHAERTPGWGYRGCHCPLTPLYPRGPGWVTPHSSHAKATCHVTRLETQTCCPVPQPGTPLHPSVCLGRGSPACLGAF